MTERRRQPSPDYLSLSPAYCDVIPDHKEFDMIRFLRMQGRIMFLGQAEIQYVSCVVSSEMSAPIACNGPEKPT